MHVMCGQIVLTYFQIILSYCRGIRAAALLGDLSWQPSSSVSQQRWRTNGLFLSTLPRKGLAGVSPIAVTRAKKQIYNAFEIVESVRLLDIYPKTPYACMTFIPKLLTPARRLFSFLRISWVLQSNDQFDDSRKRQAGVRIKRAKECISNALNFTFLHVRKMARGGFLAAVLCSCWSPLPCCDTSDIWEPASPRSKKHVRRQQHENS